MTQTRKASPVSARGTYILFGIFPDAVPMNKTMLAMLVPALITLPVNAFAQSTPRGGVCWLRTHRDCSAVVVTEFGVHQTLSANSRNYYYGETPLEHAADAGVHGAVEVGALGRVRPGIMIGPVFEFGSGETGDRRAAKLRGRYYITERESLEGSIGFLRAKSGVSDIDRTEGTGVLLEVRFNVRDYLTASIAYQDASWPEHTNPNVTPADDVRRGRVLKASVAAGSVFGASSFGAVLIVLGAYALLLGQGA